MGRIVVFFRGRNTDNIIEDARREGVLREEDTVMIVCKEHDRLARPADLTTRRALGAVLDYDEIVIVGNGGTTAQAIPLVAQIAETRGYTNGHGLCECRFGTCREYRFEPRWEVIDLQPDGIVHLVGDRIVTEEE